MSDAIKELRDYLAKSPSVVYPQDVLEYLPAIEAENAKLRERIDDAHMSRLLTENENESLRELVRDMWEGYNDPRCEECHLKDTPTCADCPICAREAAVIDRMRELGVEVDE